MNEISLGVRNREIKMRISIIKLMFLSFLSFIFNYSFCLGDESISAPQISRGVSVNIYESQIVDSPEDIKAKEYFDRIKQAVINNDYVWLANQIDYPVCLNDQINDEKENWEFKTQIFSNAKGLLEHKEEFFNQDFKDAILDQDRNKIYSNYLGYVIGYGALHFEVCAIYPTNSENSLLRNCTSYITRRHHKNVTLHSYSNLDGIWRMTDYVLNGVTQNDADDVAKANILRTAYVSSNMMSLNLTDGKLTFRISDSPKLIKSENFYFWDSTAWGSGGGGLRSGDFNFSDKIFVYKTEPINKNNDFRGNLKEIVVDMEKQKMILEYGGDEFYLFERVEE